MSLLFLWLLVAVSPSTALRRPAQHSILELRGGVSASSPSEYDSASSAKDSAGDDDDTLVDDEEEEKWFDTYASNGNDHDEIIPEDDGETPELEPEEQVDDNSSAAQITESSEQDEDGKVPVVGGMPDEDRSSGYIDRLELADAYDGDEDVGNLDDSTDPGEAAAAAASPNTIPSPTSIDAATRQVLQRELRYRPREIAAMRPEVAAVVAAKRLHRPMEGMPANWYREDAQQRTTPNGLHEKQQRQAILRTTVKVVVPAAVGILAVTKGGDIVGMFTDMFGSSSSDTAVVESDEPSSSMEDDDNLTIDAVNEEEETMVFEPPSKHSGAKPGTNELDVTWLDKLITAVEYRIKSFLRWEI